jgi:diguanylate cyclase (GGDEF)-like protein
MATILIVDDHVLNRQFLTALLGFGGHTIRTAADGREALGMSAGADLIITDILMPHMSGFEFVSRLREDEQLARIPVIFYTATYSSREARAMADQCGVHWVLPKPSSPELINATVAEALGLPAAPDAPAPARTEERALGSLPAIDRQLVRYLEQLEISRQMITQIASDGPNSSERDRMIATTAQLSASLSDLQSVSLRLTGLIDMGIDMARERDPQRLLDIACRVARHISVAGYAVIGIVEPGGGALRHFVTRGLEAPVQTRLARLDYGATLEKLRAKCGKASLPAFHPGVRSFLGVPVSTQDHSYGWIYLADKMGADTFSEIDERAVTTVATQLAVALENMELFDAVASSVAQQERLSQMYAVLSGINSAIVRIRDRRELLQEACRVAAGHGPFSMSWTGIVDQASGDGQVVGWYGGRPGYVELIEFTRHLDRRSSMHPASIALREQRQVICDDVLKEPGMAWLHGELTARGHRALAVLPLIVDGGTVGVFSLFSDTVAFFAAPEIKKLLDELAGDLSFGLQAIAREERLNYLAYYDALTGLPNSMLYTDRLSQSLSAAAGSGQGVAAILLNIERFAHLNDVMGRHAGDAILRMLAERMLDALGPELREHWCLARIGGDVFGIAISGLQHAADAAALLERHVLQALALPFALPQPGGVQEVQVAVRAGIALYPADGADAETLFKHAELALKKCKAASERYLYYAPQMNAALAVRMALEQEMHVALAEHQFAMVYQPRVDLLSGRITSAEALIRWQHPTRGLVNPADFIALAEETGQIVAIGNWVIDAVCAQQAQWQAQGLDLVPVAVNLSAVQFKKGNLHQDIADAVARHGIAQHWIEFELTESVVMDDPETAIGHLQRLKAMGTQLALDDFGTGYSSLAYLKRFPFDFVKIDRAFVTDVTDNTDDAAIAIAIIAMAHSLGLRVVAEGVETEQQLAFLRHHRCDEMQGYYFSRPVGPALFAAMLGDAKRLVFGKLAVRRENTLLVANHSQANRGPLRRLLRQQGYRVLTATSGKEALELMAIHPVQVLVAEDDMPSMGGPELLEAAKAQYPHAMGMLLPKPFDGEQLRSQIKLAFAAYHAAS